MIKDIIKQKIIDGAAQIKTDDSGFFVYLPNNYKFPVEDKSLIRKFNLENGQKITDKALGKQILGESIAHAFAEARKKFSGTDKEWEEGCDEILKLMQELGQTDKEIKNIYAPLREGLWT
jgi:hypothetical protein